MTKIIVKDGNLDSAFKMVKLIGAKDGSSRKLRERLEGYVKPGEKKRKAREEAKKNNKKKRRENY